MKLFLIFLSISMGLSCFSQKQKDSLVIVQLNSTVWNYIACTTFDGLYYPSNGLIVKTDSGLVCMDTPVNDSLTQKLIEKFHDQKFIYSIITHAHIDRMGGIRTMLNHGTKVICFNKTTKSATKEGYPKPTLQVVSNDTILKIGNTVFELYYPGWGHTTDNIVVWLPEQKILYGGCYIKSKESETLGNTKDANVKEWLTGALKLKNKFSEAKTIVPGHGNIGNIELIDKTIELLKR